MRNAPGEIDHRSVRPRPHNGAFGRVDRHNIGLIRMPANLHRDRVAIAIAVIVTLCAALLYPPHYLGLPNEIRPGPLERLETAMSDLQFRVRGVEKPNPSIVIVAADEKTAAELGRGPTSRRYHALAIHNLAADGAKVITFDVLLPQEETLLADEL